MRVTIIDALHSSGFYARFVEQASVDQGSQAAENVSERPVFVAQPLLAVWLFQGLTKAQSQEWLCYLVLSAIFSACGFGLLRTNPHRLKPVLLGTTRAGRAWPENRSGCRGR